MSNLSDMNLKKSKRGRKTLHWPARAQSTKAELEEGRANEAVDAFIIFTEDWEWSRLLMINPRTLIHLSIRPSYLPQSAGPLFQVIKPAVIRPETETLNQYAFFFFKLNLVSETQIFAHAPHVFTNYI